MIDEASHILNIIQVKTLEYSEPAAAAVYACTVCLLFNCGTKEGLVSRAGPVENANCFPPVMKFFMFDHYRVK